MTVLRRIIKAMRPRKARKTADFDRVLERLVNAEEKLKTLPELSTLQKAELEQARALEHLYNSSKIEGTQLTKERIDLAVYGPEIAPSAK